MTNEGGGAMPMNEDGALTVEDDESPLSQTGVARAASAAALIDREARQDALRDAAAALQAALQTTRTHEQVLNPYQQQALQENMGPPPSNPPRKIPPKKKDKSASSPEKRAKIESHKIPGTGSHTPTSGLNPPPLFGGNSLSSAPAEVATLQAGTVPNSVAPAAPPGLPSNQQG